MKEKISEKQKIVKLLPYILATILWTTFSLWICDKEKEYLWLILLICTGLIPLIWEIFISPNIKEFEYITKQEELQVAERNILSMKGRIRRTTYWTRVLVIFVLAIVFRMIMTMEHTENMGILAIVEFMFSLFLIIQGVKRMHDVNKSGWYLFIPIYNLILAFTKGTSGDNKYGKNPKNKNIK